jgi:hypothetical protein
MSYIRTINANVVQLAIRVGRKFAQDIPIDTSGTEVFAKKEIFIAVSGPFSVRPAPLSRNGADVIYDWACLQLDEKH